MSDEQLYLKQVLKDPDLQAVLTLRDMSRGGSSGESRSWSGLLIAQPQFGSATEYAATGEGLLGAAEGAGDMANLFGRTIGSKMLQNIGDEVRSYTTNEELNRKVWKSNSLEDLSLQLLFLNTTVEEDRFKDAWELMATTAPIKEGNRYKAPSGYSSGGTAGKWSIAIGRWLQLDKMLLVNCAIAPFDELDASKAKNSPPIGATVTLTFSSETSMVDRDQVLSWRQR